MNSENTFIIPDIPSDDDYALINLLFQSKLLKSREINTNSLTISCLDLIKRERIYVNVNEDIESVKINKNPIFKTKNQLEKELEIMEKIQFKINSKQMKKLNQKDQIILNMFKDINKTHEFNLKSMYEKILKKEVAIKFTEYFNDYVKSMERENKYSQENYKDIVNDGDYTLEGNKLSKEWKDFKSQIKSNEAFSSINDESNKRDILDKYLIYGRCFEIEKNVLKNIESNYPNYRSELFDFLKYDGADLLKIIFDKGISNGKIERRGDGSVPVGNSKYFVPGFG